MGDTVSSTSRGRRLRMATLRSVSVAWGLAAALALTGCGSSGPAESTSTDTSPAQGISDNDGERGPFDVDSFCAEIAGNTEFLSGYDVVSKTADPETEVRIICGTVGDSEPIVPFVNLWIGADRLPGGPVHTFQRVERRSHRGTGSSRKAIRAAGPCGIGQRPGLQHSGHVDDRDGSGRVHDEGVERPRERNQRCAAGARVLRTCQR